MISRPVAENREDNESSMILPIFPPEVIIEIFTYIPLKSLTRLQLVCKEWRLIIRHDRYLFGKHMDHAPIARYWYNSHAAVRPTTSVNTVRFTYLHGLDGLVLMRNKNTKKIFIWNPAIKRVLDLPDPPHHDGHKYGFTLSYDPVTMKYKIVSVYKNKESRRKCFQVLTLGGPDMTWRPLTFPDNIAFNWHEKGKKVSVVSSGGAVHCILSDKVDDVFTFQEIVSLDIVTECFVVNLVPKCLFKDWTKVCALDWNETLGFAYVNGGNLELMELEDYKKQRWSGNKRVVHLAFMKNEGDVESKLLHPLLFNKGDIWFWLEGEKFFSYKIETRRITNVVKERNASIDYKLYPYKPSLVSFEGMQPAYPELERLWRYSLN